MTSTCPCSTQTTLRHTVLYSTVLSCIASSGFTSEQTYRLAELIGRRQDNGCFEMLTGLAHVDMRVQYLVVPLR